MSNTIKSPRTHPRHKGKLIVIPNTSGEFSQGIVVDADGNPFSHEVRRPLNSTSKFKADEEKKKYKDGRANTKSI